MIPRVVHVVWIGPDPFPHEAYLRSWAAHNPAWQVRLWTDANRPLLVNEEIYDLVPVRSCQADLLRLEILWRYGGFYADADCECLRPLDPLVEDRQVVAMTGRGGGICLAAIAAVPGHPAIGRLVHGATARYRRLRASAANRRRGVSVHALFAGRYVTPVLQADPSVTQVDTGERAGSRRLLVDVDDPDRSQAYVLHHRANSWRAELGGGRRVRL